MMILHTDNIKDYIEKNTLIRGSKGYFSIDFLEISIEN